MGSRVPTNRARIGLTAVDPWLKRWWPVSFGGFCFDEGSIVSAFVVDGLGAVVYSGLPAARHRQCATGCRGLGYVAADYGCGGSAKVGEQYPAAGVGAVGLPAR
jgi:hypothetical protein